MEGVCTNCHISRNVRSVLIEPSILSRCYCCCCCSQMDDHVGHIKAYKSGCTTFIIIRMYNERNPTISFSAHIRFSRR